MNITVPDLTTSDCGWIAITAAEGGIGYWSRLKDYLPSRWYPADADKPLPVDDDFVFYALKCDNPMGRGIGTLIVNITPEVIVDGMRQLLGGGKVRADLVQQALANVREGEPGAVDADVADCILQLGIFGEVVFG